jgi:glycosidase
MIKFKKIIVIFVFLSLMLTLAACGKNEHIVRLEENIVAEMVSDNYRVYYEIFVGSFSDSDGDGMGDLKGIINRLDYLNDGNPNSGESLGVQGLWLMPIMTSPSYHKYDVRDYKSVDPKYGTIEDFELLTKEASKRGIDVIIDLVINHTSNYHDWFRAARKAIIDGDFNNKYLDYYTLVTEENKESGKKYYPLANGYYYEGNFSDQMPELNLDSQDVRNEFIDIIKFWFSKGVHGFRLDATKYVYLNNKTKNIEFWNWFMEEVRKIKPNAYVVGETWSGDSEIADYYESFSNFDFGMSQSQGAIATTANGQDTVNNFVKYLNQYRNIVTSVNQKAILTPFISNHDMNRAAGYLSVSEYRMHMAASLYLLSYGTPFIYYGEEIGLFGSRGTEQTDANRRLKMIWGDNDKVSDPIGSTFPISRQINGSVKSQLKDSESLLNHYKKLIMIRNSNPEIARGSYTPLQFTGYYSFGGFLTTYENSTVGVFHNNGDEPLIIDLSLYANHYFQNVRGYAGFGFASLDGQMLTIDPMTTVVLR